MSNTTLTAIRTKVRRITRKPSESQLTNAQLDEYINTAVLYDFPASLRLFALRTTLTFYTQPGVDVYETNTTNPIDPLYNFKNKYMAVHPPLFIAGIQSFYTQEREIFYGYYPQTNTISQTLLFGDGTTGPFSSLVIPPPIGTPPYPFILQRSVNFNCLDTNSTSMILVDYPVSNTTGALGLPGQPQVLPSPFGQINYVTGQYTLNFPNATLPLAPIWFEGILYQPGKPLCALFFDDKFTIRPVPDKTYAVQIEADIRPVEFIATTQSPELEQWWQYIAYLAAKKIFDDQMDTDSVNLMMPELKRQETMVLRTTLVQQANERTITIYTQGKNYGFGAGFFGGGGWPY